MLSKEQLENSSQLRSAYMTEVRRSSRGLTISFVVFLLLMIGYRSVFPNPSYTLRSGPEDDPKTRTTVAVFTSEEGAEVNKANCERVLAAMQQQLPAYKMRYWCERSKP